MNHVTLYSNGTAVISKVYDLDSDSPVTIQIPVSKANLDDVISSLCVFGEVAVASPPTFSPTNARETSLTLKSDNILMDMATKLAGAEVEIEAGMLYRGRLVGLQPTRKIVNQQAVRVPMLVVITEKGIQQVELDAVIALRFMDKLIQDEIDKALRASLRQIKPDSSFVELALRPLAGPTSAILQYATPVAAWKIRYHLRLNDNRLELDGQAIVDNDTDDDWLDTMITTVTGEPITFSTDLALICRPKRSHVELVDRETRGAVVAASGRKKVAERVLMESYPCLADDGDPEPRAENMRFMRRSSKAATQAQAEVRESGDLSIFHSPHPFTIQARRSAVIPLFRTTIDSGKQILFYNERQDRQSPFRAVRFVNQSGHSLGRGVCEVFIDGDFQGKSVLEITKPGQETIVIHARETGVHVFKKTETDESRIVLLKLSGGQRFAEHVARHTTQYTVVNNHSTEFQLDLEHTRLFNNTVGLEVHATIGEVTRVDIPMGERLGVQVPAMGQQLITVTEIITHQETVALNCEWLIEETPSFNKSLLDHPIVAACLELDEQIDTLQAELSEQETLSNSLKDEQKRAIELIPHAHPEQAGQWRHELAESEKQQRQLSRKIIPELKKKIKAVRQELSQKLNELVYEWKA